MSEQLPELLSALMDDELTEDELHEILTLVEEQPDTFNQLKRWHLLRALLQEQVMSATDIQNHEKTVQNMRSKQLVNGQEQVLQSPDSQEQEETW